jgi:D-alanyl-D-alanine carboxypeptidase
MKKTILLALLLTGWCTRIKAQPFDPVLAAKLQNTLENMATTNNLKGISACVLYPGVGTWKGVTGLSHAGAPITPEMEFGIASNTKLFTGVLLLKLAENNLLHLDDPISDYLPAFNNVPSAITIRQLLNHTSGLADVTSVPGYPDSVLSNPNRIFSPAEVISWIGPPLFAAGTGWSYCNTNYLLAGMVAESASGRLYGRLLRDSLLAPLQLDSTFLDVYDSIPYTAAHPWQGGIDNNSIPRKALNSAAWAAGAMYSTAGEMARWYQGLMGGQILQPGSLSEMTTFVGSGNYGIGLYETTVLGRTVWQHGGTIWGGYNSSMMYDTASGIVLCVLINQNPGQAFPVARQLLATIINNPVSALETASEEATLSIHPNPAQDRVEIELPGQRVQRVQVFCPTGGLIHDSDEVRFAVANFPPGLYWVFVRTEKRGYVGKFLKI